MKMVTVGIWIPPKVPSLPVVLTPGWSGGRRRSRSIFPCFSGSLQQGSSWVVWLLPVISSLDVGEVWVSTPEDVVAMAARDETCEWWSAWARDRALFALIQPVPTPSPQEMEALEAAGRLRAQNILVYGANVGWAKQMCGAVELVLLWWFGWA